MEPVIWDFVKVVWGLAVGWVMGDTCGDGQVFVGDIPAWVSAQYLHATSQYWDQWYGTDCPLTVDFNRSRKSKSIVANRPNSATLTFPFIESATAWVETAKKLLKFKEGHCKVQYVYYGYESRVWSDNNRR